MKKNSYKTGPDELGYFGVGDAAMGGMAVGETLMPVLHELNQGFEDAIKEYDDHDPEDHNKKKGVSIDLLALFHSTADTAHHQLFEQQKRSHNYVARLAKGYHQIDSPPPKV